jgi:hypothetical protein
MRTPIYFIILVTTIALVTLTACSFRIQGTDLLFSIQEDEEKVFADCDSFLAYYDACERFMESVPGSRCAEYTTLDIPESDRECYPIVECDWFMRLDRTAQRLSECRFIPPSEPKCIISFDIYCESFTATEQGIDLNISNRMDSHVKRMKVSLIGEDINAECIDSDMDSILASGESDIFSCTPVPAGTYAISVLHEDYRSGAMHTKEGRLVIPAENI